MLSLIVTILFALAAAYFAIQNTMGVTLVVANNVLNNVPMYLVVIGSILTGIILASIISGLNAFSAFLTLKGKERIIADDKRQIGDLQEKVHALETENTQLRSTHDAEVGETQDVQVEHYDEEPVRRPSFFHSLFHPRTEHR